MPAIARLFLIAIGTPANGRSSPARDLVGRGQGVLGEDVDERVELGVERLDAIERGLHELARGQLAGAHEAGELARRAEEEVGHGAGA